MLSQFRPSVRPPVSVSVCLSLIHRVKTTEYIAENVYHNLLTYLLYLRDSERERSTRLCFMNSN